MTLTTTTGETRIIRHGHKCLCVVNPTDLILTAGDQNGSLIWSRKSLSRTGQLHTWSPWGYGKATEGLPEFNAERADPVSGAYHLGNGYRAYNPVLMRFNCPDSLSPFGAGGINPYAYCAGDPINRTDPTGHISWQGLVGIVTGIVGLGLALFTAGASIVAAGSLAAAWSSASTTALVLGGVSLAADVTGIASGATEDVNPEMSSVLGWVSLATGVVGLSAMAPKGIITLRKVRTTGGRQSPVKISRSASIISRQNRIEPLIQDISRWEDINMVKTAHIQNHIKKSERYEVMLNAYSSNKSYVLKNMRSNRFSTPDGPYNFINPSDEPGRIYAMKYNDHNHVRFVGHTSLARNSSGRASPVRYAGILDFENGQLIRWTNESGHYRPRADLSHDNLIPWVRRLLPKEIFYNPIRG